VRIWGDVWAQIFASANRGGEVMIAPGHYVLLLHVVVDKSVWHLILVLASLDMPITQAVTLHCVSRPVLMEGHALHLIPVDVLQGGSMAIALLLSAV